jgi:hypothetical protein
MEEDVKPEDEDGVDGRGVYGWDVWVCGLGVPFYHKMFSQRTIHGRSLGKSESMCFHFSKHVLSDIRYRKTCTLTSDFVLGVGGGHLPWKLSKILMVS